MGVYTDLSVRCKWPATSMYSRRWYSTPYRTSVHIFSIHSLYLHQVVQWAKSYSLFSGDLMWTQDSLQFFWRRIAFTHHNTRIHSLNKCKLGTCTPQHARTSIHWANIHYSSAYSIEYKEYLHYPYQYPNVDYWIAFGPSSPRPASHPRPSLTFAQHILKLKQSSTYATVKRAEESGFAITGLLSPRHGRALWA